MCYNNYGLFEKKKGGGGAARYTISLAIWKKRSMGLKVIKT